MEWISVDVALPVCNELPPNHESRTDIWSRSVLTWSPLHGIAIRFLVLNNISTYGYKTMGKSAKWGEIDLGITHWMDLPEGPTKRGSKYIK